MSEESLQAFTQSANALDFKEKNGEDLCPDLDLGAAMLSVNNSVWLHQGKRYETQPKGGASRELDMTPALLAVLSKMKRQGPYVLPELKTYDDVRNVIAAVQARAGFPVTGKSHVLRHTFCSRLAMKGVPVKVIQDARRSREHRDDRALPAQ